MSHSHISSYFHCIFSTKGRLPLVTKELRIRLYPYMGGIARHHHMTSLSIGGTDNHIHILLSLPGSLAIAKAMQLIKGNSSKWVHETFPNQSDFAWQEGYGAFGMSFSHLKAAMTYIENQEIHHQKQSFEEEFVSFLKKTETPYDECSLWA